LVVLVVVLPQTQQLHQAKMVCQILAVVVVEAVQLLLFLEVVQAALA
jgi:hypothetical protein